MSDQADPSVWFTRMRFGFPWRTYQQMVLARVRQLDDTARLHLVAPPGSGKTVVGLELARQRGRPTLVLSPTATIAAQWADTVGMFLADADGARQAASTDPQRLAAVTSLTYQRLGVLDQADEVLLAAAEQAWAAQLVADGQARDLAAARERIAAMQAANPGNHRRARNRYVGRERRRLVAEGGVLPLLHPNARALIDRLAAHGVATIVVDECHHLLDHWALVVRALIERLDDVQVIGLTATLPDPDDRRSYDNYTGLLGDVTFEVPTPAVVREGDLAPWRNLVYLTTPTPEEHAVLADAQAAFQAVTGRLLGDDRLLGHAWELVAGADDGRPGATLAALLAERPLVAVAAGRLLSARGVWPPGVPTPTEMTEPLTFDDELLLFERFGLDVLALSDDPADHALLVELRSALGAFGLSLTERGLRQGRSVGDLILSFSASKDAATVDILTREAAALGPRLRAVVVTDLARASSAVARVASPLEADAGSATRVFHALIDDPATDALDPMLITGSSVLVDADHGDELVSALNAQLVVDGLRASCRYEPTDHPRVLQIVGQGQDWSSGTYVRLLTEVFESGVTRCLVGTRGLFGEGWDALGLNTLVDLTSVTTSTGVQQLRGRSIRLDPSWAHKVAHDWDVICVDTGHERGDLDLRRLQRRHRHLWGVVADAPRATGTVVDGVARPPGPGLPRRGDIVKGLDHVSARLVRDLWVRGWQHTPFPRHTGRSLAAIGDRSASYELWGVGEPYANRTLTSLRLRVEDLRLRTVLTVRGTLASLVRRFRLAAAAALTAAVTASTELLQAGADAALVAAIGVLGWSLVRHRRLIGELARMLLVGQPPDSIVRDVASATLTALQEAGELDPGILAGQVQVVWTDQDELEVVLDHVEPGPSAVLAAALAQVLGPVDDPRYLIRRTDARLPSVGAQALWLPLRTLAFRRWGRDSWHAVPAVLGTHRERAERFSTAWAATVGGGELLYTRSDEGRRALLDARAQHGVAARNRPYEIWR